MSGGDVPIIVVGGGSRIARELADLLGETTTVISRRPSGLTREIPVRDYDVIPPDAFRGAGCVINCVGTHHGDADHLHRVNAGIPPRIAATAKEAGVGRMIHLSSFSVFGRVQLIDGRTNPAPTTAYGRSRLAGDTALLDLADTSFAMTIVRLPLVYARDAPGKLGQLMRLWVRTGFVPVPKGDVARAMIGTRLAAEVAAGLIRNEKSGIVLAADPLPFTYRDAARVRPEKLRCLEVPRIVTGLVKRVAPEIGERLFSDSRLADADNRAIADGLASRLYDDIAALRLR